MFFSLPQAVQTGQLFNAIGDGRAAYITRSDVARSAAAALAASFDGRRTLDITGPEALSQSEIAAIVSKITGKTITYIPLDLETLIQNMVAGGLPRPVAESFASFDAGIAQDKFSAVSGAVKDLTGRKPTSVEEFLTAQRDTLLPAAAV